MSARPSVALLLAFVILCGCSKSSTPDTQAAQPNPGVAAAASAKTGMVKLSKYDGAQFCDLAAAADGTLHALFTDSPSYGKPTYVYYSASTDGGATWSDPKNLSDDESGIPAAYCRVVIDGKGRIYAIWKYCAGTEIIDGPGGAQGGTICYRCLDGGAWSKTVALNAKPAWAYSFFATVDPHGFANIVWSQIAPDAAASRYVSVSDSIADLVQQAALDGATPQVHSLIVPAPVASDAFPPNLGFINIRGFIDAAGLTHFMAERPSPETLIHFDGKNLTTVYTFIPYVAGNTFDNPATLLADADGVEHLIRCPEQSEVPCLRDYLVSDKISDPTDIIAVKDAGKGGIFTWQVAQGPKGKMAVLCSLSQTSKVPGYGEELYVSYSDGKGQWTPPVTVTNNAAAATGTSGGAAMTVTSYSPQFSSLAFDKDGHPCVLMVNVAHTIVGINTVGVTSGGQAVTGMDTSSTNSTQVYFLKL